MKEHEAFVAEQDRGRWREYDAWREQDRDDSAARDQRTDKRHRRHAEPQALSLPCFTLRDAAAPNILTSAMLPSARSRTLISLLVVIVLLSGVVLSPGHTGLDFYLPVVSLLSLLTLGMSCRAYFTRPVAARPLASFLPAAPDRAPPSNQTALSV